MRFDVEIVELIDGEFDVFRLRGGSWFDDEK